MKSGESHLRAGVPQRSFHEQGKVSRLMRVTQNEPSQRTGLQWRPTCGRRILRATENSVRGFPHRNHGDGLAQDFHLFPIPLPPTGLYHKKEKNARSLKFRREINF